MARLRYNGLLCGSALPTLDANLTAAATSIAFAGVLTHASEPPAPSRTDPACTWYTAQAYFNDPAIQSGDVGSAVNSPDGTAFPAGTTISSVNPSNGDCYTNQNANTDGTGAPLVIGSSAPPGVREQVPTIAAGDYLPLVLDADTDVAEIVWLTAYAKGATTGTIERAQEGTGPSAHTAGASIRHGPTVDDFTTAPSNPAIGWVLDQPGSGTHPFSPQPEPSELWRINLAPGEAIKAGENYRAHLGGGAFAASGPSGQDMWDYVYSYGLNADNDIANGAPGCYWSIEASYYMSGKRQIEHYLTLIDESGNAYRAIAIGPWQTDGLGSRPLVGFNPGFLAWIAIGTAGTWNFLVASAAPGAPNSNQLTMYADPSTASPHADTAFDMHAPADAHGYFRIDHPSSPGGLAFSIDAQPSGLAIVGGNVAFQVVRALDYVGDHIPIKMQNNLGTVTYAQFDNYGRTWHLTGADGHSGANMMLDSGDGGSYIDAKCYAFRILSYADSSIVHSLGLNGVGFYGVPAVAQPSGAAQAAVATTAPAGGVGTAAGGWDTAAHRDTAITTLNALVTLTNAIRAALVAEGLMKGGA
jgi:hypothetical protein